MFLLLLLLLIIAGLAWAGLSLYDNRFQGFANKARDKALRGELPAAVVKEMIHAVAADAQAKTKHSTQKHIPLPIQ